VAETAERIDKAIKAQMKAYAHHNLPEYLSQLAAFYDLAGDTPRREEFTRLFRQAQEEFKPDQIDSIFSDWFTDGLTRSDTPPALREAFDQIAVTELYKSGFMKFV
jgi:hypothetical protein